MERERGGDVCTTISWTGVEWRGVAVLMYMHGICIVS